MGTPSHIIEDYPKHVDAEIEHYTKIFSSESARQTLIQPVPLSWMEVERRAAAKVRRATGLTMNEHVLARLTRHPGVRMLSLGSGPGGIELEFARSASQAELICLDLNPALLRLGSDQARAEGLNVRFEEADLNTLALPTQEFDLVFCHASLHHVMEIQHVAAQIRRSLRRGGELITVDVVSQNGYQMWPETRETVQALWRTLPYRFRVNHTAYGEPRLDQEIWEADTSQSGMECIRSSEILPVLSRMFETEHFVPYFSICRRLLDTMYGPNYDLSQSLDLALLNWIWELDEQYLAIGQLRPETFFGIYR